MSVTGDYCLVLGKDLPERGTPERDSWTVGVLDASTRVLATLIDEADWWEKPIKGTLEGWTTYFWWNVRGPYFKRKDGSPPIERLIIEVKKIYPQIDSHYSLFVWCEQNLQRIDGRFCEHNKHTMRTATIFVDDGHVDIREHFRKANGLDRTIEPTESTDA